MFADRVIEILAPGFTGIGTFNLGGATTNARSFASVPALAAGAFYVAHKAVAGAAGWAKWEKGFGVPTAGSPDTLTRVLLESFDGSTYSTSSKIDWQAGDGTIVIYNPPVAEVLRYLLDDYRGTTAPPWAVNGTRWLDATGAPTSVIWKRYDGAQWITIGTFNETANTFAPAFSATARILARKTAGAGPGEEATLSEILDFIGSAAQGDILYRGASAWVRLAAGTANHLLGTGGAGGNPSWRSIGDALDFINTTRGHLLFRGASAWTTLAPGSAGQFLQTAGGGADPSWASIIQNLRLGGIVDTGTSAAAQQVSGLAALGARHIIFFGKAYTVTDTVTVTVRALDSGGGILTATTSGPTTNTGNDRGLHFFGFIPQALDGLMPKIFLAYWGNGGNGIAWGGSSAAGTVDQIQFLASSGNVSGNLQAYYVT